LACAWLTDARGGGWLLVWVAALVAATAALVVYIAEPPAPANRAVTLLSAWDTLDPDVRCWLMDTYTPRGVQAWLYAYATAGRAQRERMLVLARTDTGGL
jgi:hypothetical protein